MPRKPDGALSNEELLTLRAYGSARVPLPIPKNDRTFMRLHRLGLVTGAIGTDHRGDPVGVVRVTVPGQALLLAAG